MELEERLRVLKRTEEGTLDVPLLVMVTLGVFAALFVGFAVTSSLQAGLTSVAIGFFIAVSLFVATVGVFELGKRVGAR